MPRNLLRDERSQILVLHRQGLNIMQISQEMNAARSTVRRWIRRYAAEGTLADRPRRHPPRIIVEADAKEMVKSYKKDSSIKTSTLAVRYGCSIQTIRNTLRRAGVYQARPTLQNVAKRKGLPALESTDNSDDSESLSDTEYQPNRQRQNVQDYKIEQANSISESNLQSSEKSTNECEIYAQLLGHKLQKIDEDDRLILMNKIDNLVFQTTMESKAKKEQTFKKLTTNQAPHANTDSTRSDTPCFYEYDNDISSPSYQPKESPIEFKTKEDIKAELSHFGPIFINSPQSSPSNQQNMEEI